MAIKPTDGVRCILLSRSKKSQPWELLYIVQSPENGWRLGRGCEDEQHRMNDLKFETIVVAETDYDNGRFKPLKPPKGFDFTIPEGEVPKSLGAWINQDQPRRRVPAPVTLADAQTREVLESEDEVAVAVADDVEAEVEEEVDKELDTGGALDID